MLEGLKDIPIVGDVRGMGHFFAIEVREGPGDEGAAVRRRGELAPQATSSRTACSSAA